jgi:hypothetical protein
MSLGVSRFGRSPRSRPTPSPSDFSAIASPLQAGNTFSRDDEVTEGAMERAAGTGLTGHSTQEFMPFHLGPLENEATTIRLRIVIGTEAAIAEQSARPLPGVREPARPAARP